MENIDRILKLAGLQEADVIRSTSPEMDDYHDEKTPQETYMVAWSAQSHEWYGQGDPEDGNGRYKAKGDGGDVIAINVPDEHTANKLLDDLNKRLESENFGEVGKDYYYLSDTDAYVDTMTNYKKRFTHGGSFDQEYFNYETKNAKDFSKQSALECIKEELSSSLKAILGA